VRGQQGNFTIKNCHNLGTKYITLVNNDSTYGLGGLIGSGCNNFKVKDCTNSSQFTKNSGGIVAPYCCKFEISNCKNLNNSKNILYKSAGIIGQNCAEFKIDNCINYQNIHETSASGIIGGDCFNFEINKCKNYGIIDGVSTDPTSPFYIFNMMGGDCYIKIKDCKNYSDVFNSGIVGSNCNDFEIENCINMGNLIWNSSGGIVGVGSSNFKMNNCKNYGDINDMYSGGIVANSIGFNPDKLSLYVKISNCINYGMINGKEAGGITGRRLGVTYTTNASFANFVNIKIELYNCINRGKLSENAINNGAGGISGSYLGNAHVYILDHVSNSALIKITKCRTKYGNLIGNNCLFNYYYDNNLDTNIPVPNRLVIKESYTDAKVPLVLGFILHEDAVPKDTRTAVYIKKSGKEVNLLHHPDYISHD
jgi:hypothetical protein